MIDKTTLINHKNSGERYAGLKVVLSNIDNSAREELGLIILWSCGFVAVNGCRMFKTECGISITVLLGILNVSFIQCSNNNNVIFSRVDQSCLWWVGYGGVPS